MKVWGLPHGPQARGVKIKDAVVTYKQKDGSIIIRSWPRKRGGYQSERQRQWGEWFAAGMRWCSMPDWGSQLDALQTTQNTIFQPLDYLLKLFSGQLWEVHMDDGTVLWNVWKMAKQIQVELDTISDQPGAILYRGPTEWVALTPGDPGDLLTMGGSGLQPAWGKPPAAGGGKAVFPFQAGSRRTDAAASMGLTFTPTVDCEIYGIWPHIQTYADGSYIGWVATMTGNVVDEVLATSAPVTPGSVSTNPLYLPLTSVAKLTAGKKFGYGVSLVGETTKTAQVFFNTGAATPFLPTSDLNMIYQYYAGQIAPGVTLTTFAAAGGIGCVYGVS